MSVQGVLGATTFFLCSLAWAAPPATHNQNLVLLKSQDVSLNKEKLELSPESISAEYEFENLKKQDAGIQLGFPLPVCPLINSDHAGSCLQAPEMTLSLNGKAVEGMWTREYLYSGKQLKLPAAPLAITTLDSWDEHGNLLDMSMKQYETFCSKKGSCAKPDITNLKLTQDELKKYCSWFAQASERAQCAKGQNVIMWEDFRHYCPDTKAERCRSENLQVRVSSLTPAVLQEACAAATGLKCNQEQKAFVKFCKALDQTTGTKGCAALEDVTVSRVFAWKLNIPALQKIAVIHELKKNLTSTESSPLTPKMAKIVCAKDKTVVPQARLLEYALNTEMLGAKPMPDFDLVITKDKGEEISTCFEGLSQVSSTQLEAHKTNFTTKSNIAVLWFHPSTTGQ